MASHLFGDDDNMENLGEQKASDINIILQRLRELETKNRDLESKINKLSSKYNNLEKKYSDLDNWKKDFIKELEESDLFKGIKNNISNLSNKYNTLEEKVSNIDRGASKPEKGGRNKKIGYALGIAFGILVGIGAGALAYWSIQNTEETKKQFKATIDSMNLDMQLMKNVTQAATKLSMIGLLSQNIYNPAKIAQYLNQTDIIMQQLLKINQTYGELAISKGIPLEETIKLANATKTMLEERMVAAMIKNGIVLVPWDILTNVTVSINEQQLDLIVFDVYNYTSAMPAGGEEGTGVYFGLPAIVLENFKKINKTIYNLTGGEAQALQSKNPSLWRDTGLMVYYDKFAEVRWGDKTIIVPQVAWYLFTDRNGRIVKAIDLYTGKDVTSIIRNQGIDSITDLNGINTMIVPAYEWQK